MNNIYTYNYNIIHDDFSVINVFIYVSFFSLYLPILSIIYMSALFHNQLHFTTSTLRFQYN